MNGYWRHSEKGRPSLPVVVVHPPAHDFEANLPDVVVSQKTNEFDVAQYPTTFSCANAGQAKPSGTPVKSHVTKPARPVITLLHLPHRYATKRPLSQTSSPPCASHSRPSGHASPATGAQLETTATTTTRRSERMEALNHERV